VFGSPSLRHEETLHLPRAPSSHVLITFFSTPALYVAAVSNQPTPVPVMPAGHLARRGPPLSARLSLSVVAISSFPPPSSARPDRGGLPFIVHSRV